MTIEYYCQELLIGEEGLFIGGKFLYACHTTISRDIPEKKGLKARFYSLINIATGNL